MKITFVAPTYRPAIGGCEIHSHELLTRLATRHSVRVITLLNNQEDKIAHPDLWRNCLLYACRGGERSEVDGIPVSLISLAEWERRLFYPALRYYHRMEAPAMALVERLFAAKIAPLLGDTDVVHSLHAGTAFLGRAAQRAAAARGLPFVFTPVLHEFSGWDHLLQERDAVGQSSSGEEIPHVCKEPATYHDRYWGELVASADGVIAFTEHERRVLIREGAAADRVQVTGIGAVVDPGGPSRAEIRERYGLGDAPVVLFLGRKHELKGVGEILQSTAAVWQRFPETRFAFVGPPEGVTSAMLARYAGEPRVLDIPAVSQAEKSGWLRACDIFVNPSLHESFGGVFVEAWMFGRPVIAGDVPPVREVCGDGAAGILVPRRDPRRIADAVIRLIADPEEARRLGDAGKERATHRYSWERIVELTEAAYGQTLEQHQ